MKSWEQAGRVGSAAYGRRSSVDESTKNAMVCHFSLLISATLLRRQEFIKHAARLAIGYGPVCVLATRKVQVR